MNAGTNNTKTYHFPPSPCYKCGDKSGEGEWIKMANASFYLCPKCHINQLNKINN